MGVPKFFRWMSERYPTISLLIAENRIPEFDCLYLDMNGIIHNCTHKDDDSVTFRMSEEKMFIAIFNYIEHLFGKIKPQKLFFMAIDGVAPRAKMNQQRARRFRTALDAENAMKKAINNGVEMPEEEAFDSNCITPGTEFMAKLTNQLKYFINKKVSEDIEWQGVEIVLSGHEVPGEGEHKIMEYIRLAKAQPDYDPNIRHCLYGLDADLIMLGLSSHDPHFCLLREEVTFGRQNKGRSKELEHQNFFLMHLSIVREYLEYEFQELKEPGVLSFPFDMERVIDDFILLAFFVGNDFIPNLPHLHINEGALALQFKVYKEILPKTGGYINEHGVINLERLSLLLEALAQYEQGFFEAECSDANWLSGKQQGHIDALEKARKGRLVLTTEQKDMFKKIKKWVGEKKKGGHKEFHVPVHYAAKDRKFVEDLAASLRLQCENEYNENDEKHLVLRRYPDINDDESDEEEGQTALLRVFKTYEKAPVVDVSAEDAEATMQKKYDERFFQWKNDYYKDKFGFGLDDEQQIKELAENYVEGLQWVLYYYYQGVASWSWFYRYHYSPKISDICKGLGANLKFKLGTPFRPYEQLMGVLPDRSKKTLPEAYHDLMTNPDSPIIDFYPRTFELDMNGKKMEWEAVVKIPFIDQDRLIKAMRNVEHHLTPAQRARNDFGVSLKFSYSPRENSFYPTSMPGVFPDIVHCHCVVNTFELPVLEGLEIIVGLCDGVKLGKHALAGFPSLKTLKHTAQLDYHKVNVFHLDSRNESMVITLENSYAGGKVEEAKNKLGRIVHVGYPFLQEAKVTAVSDELFRYVLSETGAVIPVPHTNSELNVWKKKADRMEEQYSKRMGIVIGPVEVVAHVEMLKGMKKTDEGAMVKQYDLIPGIDADYAAQTIVDEVMSEDLRFMEKAPVRISEEFPDGTRAFFLGEYNYGRPLEVIRSENNRVDIWTSTMKNREPDFGTTIAQNAELYSLYTPSYAVARKLGLNALTLSRITSSFSVLLDDQRLNLGLNLKFEAKKLKVLGYSRKRDNGWEFSNKAIDLIREYTTRFPHFFTVVQRNPQADLYQDTDFYPPSESKAKMKEIQDWLKSIESKSLEKVSLEAQQLDGDAVKQIEEAADAYLSVLPVAEPKRVRNVPRNALLKPSDAEHRLQNQRFDLGDRVVYVQDSGKVPIASRGTVIGLTRTTRETLLDIVFDHTFMSGTTLGDRCSPFRGMTIPISSVINLTNRQLVAGSKASTSMNKVLPLCGGVSTSIASGFRPAPLPTPPTGSYSGAASGQPYQNGGGRGGRGRGRGSHPSVQNSGSRGGGTSRGQTFARGGAPVILQRRENGGQGGPNAQSEHEQTAGGSKHSPGQYQNVPPPAILNSRGGRGTGRGFRGRGRGSARGARGGATTQPVQVGQPE